MSPRIHDHHVPATREQILACRGVYIAADVARHFEISRRTVYRLWETEDDPMCDPPNIWSTRLTRELIKADAGIWISRGLTVPEIAAELGTTAERIRAVLADEKEGAVP